MELAGKRIILGVSGGIAAYKSAELVRLLIAKGAEVDVVMTHAATQFVGPLTFQALSGNPVHTEMFDLVRETAINHISLADRADLIVVAPATADLMAKVACGIADELLPTIILAAKSPVLFAPAMNVRMWENAVTRQNVAKLKGLKYLFVGPDSGGLACGHIGAGRMAEPPVICEEIISCLLPKPLSGKKIIISAGPTREPFDAVRFISNRSSGRMGYALARAAFLFGADVTLVSGPTSIPHPLGMNIVNVETTAQMSKAIKKNLTGAFAVIMAAAVADFRPADIFNGKTPKSAFPKLLKLEPTEDIVASLPKKEPKVKVIGFAAQTGEISENALKKLSQKKLFAIIANDIAQKGIGFDSLDNEVTIFFSNGRIVSLPRAPKEELAFSILATLFEFTWPTNEKSGQ